jgi:hypothetical protein
MARESPWKVNSGSIKNPKGLVGPGVNLLFTAHILDR